MLGISVYRNLPLPQRTAQHLAGDGSRAVGAGGAVLQSMDDVGSVSSRIRLIASMCRTGSRAPGLLVVPLRGVLRSVVRCMCKQRFDSV